MSEADATAEVQKEGKGFPQIPSGAWPHQGYVVRYAQCGGSGWTGQTTCQVGSTCSKISEWYSQCLPGVP